MQAGRFRDLLDSRGPFVSVYFDDSHSADCVEEKWRGLREQLVQLGADEALADDVHKAVMDWRPSSYRGRAVVACADGVVYNEHLLRPTRTTVVRVSELPYIVPIVEHGVESPDYLLAMVDSAGADVCIQIGGTPRLEMVEGGTGFVVGLLATLLHQTPADAVFVAGPPRARAELVEALPVGVCEQVVSLPINAERGEYDRDELQWAIEAWFLNRHVSVLGDAAERYTAEVGRRSGRAAEGLAAVCKALHHGAVDTLIVGGIGDATVVADARLTNVAPNPEMLMRQGAAPSRTLRADEALPFLAISAGASLVRTDERIAPADGIGAVLRYAPTR